MNSNPTSDVKQPREPRRQPRFANTLNAWLFLFFVIMTASHAYSYDLQKPLSRLGLFAMVLLTVSIGILAIQDRLEQRIATLLDCLERKGVLSAEERAAIGIVPPKTVEGVTMRGVMWLALIILGGAALLIALLFFFATCNRPG